MFNSLNGNAAISRIIKEQGKESAFRKAERGRFEAV
jgi:hypothetical protein